MNHDEISKYDIGYLVVPAPGWGVEGVDYGVGLVIDILYEDENGGWDPPYYCVLWKHEHQWWNEGELLPYG